MNFRKLLGMVKDRPHLGSDAFKNRLDPASIVECYMEGRFEVHIHVVFRLAEDETREFCAIYDPVSRPKRRSWSYLHVQRTRDAMDEGVPRFGPQGQQVSVLVDVLKRSEAPDRGVSKVRIPSVVWLMSGDECTSRRTEAEEPAPFARRS